MTGSYLFNHESYYNGLMTDLGLYASAHHRTICCTMLRNSSSLICPTFVFTS